MGMRRKMQRILWMEKKTNESVRLEIGIEEDETLQQTAIRKKLGFFWTCYAIRWIWKRNDAGMRRGMEEERAIKRKMDIWNTWSNWNEAGRTKRHDKRKETMEKACRDGCQSSKNWRHKVTSWDSVKLHFDWSKKICELILTTILDAVWTIAGFQQCPLPHNQVARKMLQCRIDYRLW